MGVDWPGYTLRGQGQKRLHTATHVFFRESKYLLQLLRHAGLVRIADEEGFTHLHIGPDTDTEIVGADLHLSSQAIRERHEALCRRTIKEVATEAVRPQLETKADRSLKQWVDWLKKTE